MSRGRRWSIRSLLAALVLALTIPLTVLSGYFGMQAYHSQRQVARAYLMGLVDITSAGIQQFLHDSRALLEGLAEEPALAALDPSRCGSHFSEASRLLLTPTYANLASWRLDGTPICSLQPMQDPRDMAGAPGLAEALAADGSTLTPVQLGRRSGRWITAITLPLRDSAGVKTGMLSLSVDLVRFQEILAQMDVPAGTIVSVTELDGTVVARSVDAERWVGESPPAADAASPDDPTFTIRGYSRARTFDGEDFSWGFVRVPATDWVVYAGLPTEQVFGHVWAGRLRFVLLALAALAGAYLLAWRVYRRVADPLRALVDGIAEATPDEPAELPTDGPEEISWVAERFNQVWAARASAEKAREQSDERIRSLVENAVTGMCVTTVAGRFVQVNQAMVDLLGYQSRDELLATPAVALYPTPEDRRRHVERNGHRESFRGIPLVWQRKDGTQVNVRISGRRLLLEGGEPAWEVTVEDVTELTRLQAQALQAQKMEALGRLAGGVAHDFNNLLTVIQGQAEILKNDPKLDEEQREQADEIYIATVRGAALNRQLLAFGRRSPGDRRVLELNSVVREFELVLRRAAGEGIAMEVDLADGPTSVRADQSQLEQILMNLVVNARDATTGDGTVRLATRTVDVTPANAARHAGARPGRHVVLTVTDSGSGIPEEVLPHIFEPFYTTKPHTKGTGLGLATVYGIVTDSGGHVRVSSKPGQGTSISVFLPVFDGAPSAPVPAPEPRPARKGSGRVLLVEDEEGVRRLAAKILERAGYEVVTAGDGLEARRIAASSSDVFDLLLTDIVMPGMRGHQLAQALAAEGRISRAVFFSGYPEGFSDEGLEGVDAWAFIAKPFTGGDLLAAIDEVLHRPPTPDDPRPEG